MKAVLGLVFVVSVACGVVVAPERENLTWADIQEARTASYEHVLSLIEKNQFQLPREVRENCPNRYVINGLLKQNNAFGMIDSIPSIGTIVPLNKLHNCHVIPPEESKDLIKFRFNFKLKALTCHWILQMEFFQLEEAEGGYESILEHSFNATIIKPAKHDAKIFNFKGWLTPWTLTLNEFSNDFDEEGYPADRMEISHLNSAIVSPLCTMRSFIRTFCKPKLFYYPAEEEIRLAIRKKSDDVDVETTLYVQCPYQLIRPIYTLRMNHGAGSSSTLRWEYFQVILGRETLSISIYVNGVLIVAMDKPPCSPFERFLVIFDKGAEYYFGVQHEKLIEDDVFSVKNGHLATRSSY